MDEGQVLAERQRSFARDCLDDSWTIIDALPGGYQQGALEVIRSDGTRGVFKAGHEGDDDHALAVKAAAIERACANGWPAAPWLTWGTSGERPWVVQQFAEGRPTEGLSPALEVVVLAAVDAQRDIPSLPAFDWTEQCRAITTPRSYWHQRCDSFGGRARTLGRMLGAAVSTATDADPPPTDLVHGDFATDNLLEADGGVTIIDTQSIGRGSRAIDLTAMTVHCHAWEQGTATAERFFGAALRVADSAAVRYAAARALGVTVFAMDNYPGFVDTLAGRLLALEDVDGWR